MSDHAERNKLSAWLDEWRLHQAMDAAEEALAHAGTEPRPGGCNRPAGVTLPQRPYRSGLRAGDILLLKPVTPLTRLRPIYVAVLQSEGSTEWWRVAPFGRLTLPATPDEVETGMKAPPLRVLCVWNGHVVPAARLQVWAWPVHRMTEAALAAALAAGPSRRGPRLVHPLDPRHAYLDAERALWPEWERAAGAAAAPPESAAAATDYWEGALAADPPDEPYGAEHGTEGQS